MAVGTRACSDPAAWEGPIGIQITPISGLLLGNYPFYVVTQIIKHLEERSEKAPGDLRPGADQRKSREGSRDGLFPRTRHLTNLRN